MKKIIGVMAVAMLLIGALIAPATAVEEVDPEIGNTCKDTPPFSTNLEASTSGDWGSIDFSDTEKKLTLTVNEGWEVELCVKAGSKNAGDGPENAGTFGEGEHEIGHSSGKDLSHYAYIATELPPPPPTVTVEFTKVWEGDDEGDAVASLDVSDSEGLIANLASGDSVDVTDYQGETLSLEEVLDEELPENCEYTSDLADSIEIPQVDEDTVIPVTATNTVVCTEVQDTPPLEQPEVEPGEEEPEVEGVSVEKKVETEVLAETATLPQTGVPALVLALLGLLAVGSGGAILRRR